MQLSELIRLSNEAQARSAATSAGVASAFGSAMGESEKVASAHERIGASSAILAAQEGAGLLEAQENARKFARAAGTDISSEGEILTLLGAKQRELAQDVLTRSARVQRLADVSNLGNPLGFIYDAFFGDSERAELATARDNLASVTESIRGLNQSTSTTAQSQQAIAETISEASVAASAQLELDNAAVKAAESRIRTASLNVDMLTTLNSLDRQRLDDSFRIFQAQEMAESRALAREQRRALAEERKAKRVGEQELIEDYNTGARILGVRPVRSVAEIDRAARNGVDVNFIMNKGYEFAQGEGLAFGTSSPMEALERKAQFPNMQLPEIQASSIQLAEAYASEFSRNPQDFLIAAGMAKNSYEAGELLRGAKSAKAKRDLMDSAIQARFLTMATAGMNPTDPSHPLAIAPIGEAAGSPILDSNPFLSRFVKPIVNSDPTSMMDINHLIELSRDPVLKGELSTSDVAEGIHSMVELLSAKTTLSRGYHKIAGFPPLPGLLADLSVEIPSVGAPYGLGLSGLIKSKHTQKVDLWDKADLNKFIADYYRKSIGSRAGAAIVELLSGGNN